MYRQLHYFSLRPGYYITSHQHPFYHVNLYLEGSMTFHANGKNIVLTQEIWLYVHRDWNIAFTQKRGIRR